MRPSKAEYLEALCRSKFDAFSQKAFSIIHPGLAFDYSWHLGCIAEHCQAVYDGEIQRLIINEPPRMLKSEQVAQFYPAWVLGKQPNHQFIGASYAGKLAKRNVMNARKILRDEWYRQAFPDTVMDVETAEHFTTTANGQYMGAGLTGTITGFGADTLLMDDVLSPMEAASDTMREATNEFIRSTLFSRYNDERVAKTILIMQRVHEDDPTGNLLRDGGWHLLSLPAEAPTRTIITLRDKTWIREAGDLLSPDRLNKAMLDQKRQDLGTYNYYGQYQQVPVPLGGGEFKSHWMQRYTNGTLKPRDMNVAIIVDQAGGEDLNRKKKKLSDWSAILVIGAAPDNNYYLLDMVRDRFNPTDRINTIFMLHRRWNEICKKPPKVGCEQIGLMTDAHYIREKQKQESYNFPVIPLGGGQRMSKEERIRKLIPIVENGRFYVPDHLFYVDVEGKKWDLVKEMIDVEMKTFPKSRYDDIIDCASRCLDAELELNFPKLKPTMVSRAFSSRDDGGGSWMSF